MFLQRHRFPGRAVLIAMLTFPLAFPGVVVGFPDHPARRRQGLIGDISSRLFGEKLVFAYSIYGLFLGYLYFSIPACHSHDHGGGAETRPRPGGGRPLARRRAPGRCSATSCCQRWGRRSWPPGPLPPFATAMGAFGTAFTLATNIDVLPMLIYTEFTLAANFATSAALSVGLGIIAWAILAVARSFSGGTVAAAG